MPEGVVDVIPVDLVAGAILAVAAKGPEPGANPVYHVASGVRNPLLYGRLVELCEDWFGRHPLYDDRGQPISVPEWSFPGRGRVQRQLQRATKLMDGAEKVLNRVPLPRAARRAGPSSWTTGTRMAKRALGYVELYGAYTETEARYRVDRLLSLTDVLGDEDRALFAFDPARDRLGPLRPRRPPALGRRARPGPHDARQDDDHPRPGRAGTPGHPLPRPPPGRVRPREDAHRLQRRRLLRLAGQPAPPGRASGRLRGRAAGRRRRAGWPSTAGTAATSSAPSTAATRARRWPRSRRTPGSCSIGSSCPGPSRRASPGCASTGASATGPSSSPAPSTWSSRPSRRSSTTWSARTSANATAATPGGSRTSRPSARPAASLLADYAEEHGLKLSESVAYADSSSDLAMLEAVGFPVAVNPDTRLAGMARRRGWHVEHWSKAKGGSDRPLPLGSFDTARPGRRWSGVLVDDAVFGE